MPSGSQAEVGEFEFCEPLDGAAPGGRTAAQHWTRAVTQRPWDFCSAPGEDMAGRDRGPRRRWPERRAPCGAVRGGAGRCGLLPALHGAHRSGWSPELTLLGELAALY